MRRCRQTKERIFKRFGLSTGNSYRPPIPAVGPRISAKHKAHRQRDPPVNPPRMPTGALKVIDDKGNQRYLTSAEESQLRGEIAHAYFIFGVDAKAIRQALRDGGKP